MASRLLLLALALLPLLPPRDAPAAPQTFGTDLAGHPVTTLASPGTRAVVLLFIASDCPISNRYLPELGHLRQEFTPRGVAFWFVYPNLTETPAGIRAHQASFGNDPHILTDPHQQLTALTGAKVTPEAAILLPGPAASLRPVYVGRIDDRYRSIGNERPQATRHDLEAAIAAVLSGQRVLPPGGPPVGCGIVSTR